MSGAASRWTVQTSGYHSAGQHRAGQVRLAHLIPPDGTFPRRGSPAAACGMPWWDAQDAPRQTLPLAHPLPDGLTWCGKCLGIAAVVLDQVDAVVRVVLDAAVKV